MRRSADPSHQPQSANDHLKSQFRSWLWSSIVAATVLHFGAFGLWPELTAADLSIDSSVTTTIALPPEILLPEPPTPIERPATPVVAAVDVAADLTIPRTTFRANPHAALIPPPATAPGEAGAASTFTPYTVRPEIRNRADVQRAMSRVYPQVLRDAGIGGTVELALFIDTTGAVVQARVEGSSGHPSLDEAAMALTEVFRFSPALNRDKRVAVWVSFPIVFEVR